MPTLEEILNNTEVPDDLEISLGDKGSLKLGELRSGLRTRDEQIAARGKEAEEWRNRHSTLEGSVSSLLALAGKQTDDDASRPAPVDPKESLREALRPLLEKDDGIEALMQDKLFGKALTAVEERAFQRAMKQNEELRNEFNSLKSTMDSGFKAMTQAQLSERADRWYGINRKEIPADDKGRRMSIQEIHQYGVDHNMVVPKTNLVDYDAVLDSMTAPVRRQNEMSEAERRGFQKGLEQGRSQAGKVIPLMSERSAGGVDGKPYSTTGKSAKQIVSERLQQGLAELSAEEG